MNKIQNLVSLHCYVYNITFILEGDEEINIISNIIYVLERDGKKKKEKKIHRSDRFSLRYKLFSCIQDQCYLNVF